MIRCHSVQGAHGAPYGCLNDPFLDEAWLDATVGDNLAGSGKVERLPPAPGFESKVRTAHPT